jgi:hypothetical protein
MCARQDVAAADKAVYKQAFLRDASAELVRQVLARDRQEWQSWHWVAAADRT